MEGAKPVPNNTVPPSVPITPRKRHWRGAYDWKERCWKCNCNPSEPALHLQAKRENENKGRWFYRCHLWGSGCNFFLWADEAQDFVEEEDRRMEKQNLADPPPPSYNYPKPPEWIRPRTPVPSPRPRDSEKQKKTRKPGSNKRSFPGPENEDESTDIDTRNANELSQDSDVASSDDEDVTAKPSVIESSRKERRTSAKDSPSVETARAGSRVQGSFATTATTSFVTAPTSFTSIPLTPNTDPRPHRPLNTAEGDIFTTSPLANKAGNNLFSKFVSASGSKGSIFATETPETPKGRQEKHPSFGYASPTSPDNPKGFQTPPAQDNFLFYPELGKISADLRKNLEFLEQQAKQTHGFKQPRDVNRELQEARDELQKAHKEIDTLKSRIQQLEMEKEMTRQINVNLKSQLDAMRLQSPSVGLGTRASSMV